MKYIVAALLASGFCKMSFASGYQELICDPTSGVSSAFRVSLLFSHDENGDLIGGLLQSVFITDLNYRPHRFPLQPLISSEPGRKVFAVNTSLIVNSDNMGTEASIIQANKTLYHCAIY